MFTIALILTNFANNAAMAVVLMPVVLNFSNQLGIDPMPVATGVILMVFVAMLTPCRFPTRWSDARHEAHIHHQGHSADRVSPVCILALVMYIFIGYPLAKMLML